MSLSFFLKVILPICLLIIAIFTFIKQFYSKPVEEFNHLKAQFKATQKLSLEFQSELEALVSKYNAYNSIMFHPNITYGAYLSQLKESFKINLSDEVYNQLLLDRAIYTKSNIESFTRSLEAQFNELLKLQNEARIIAKSMDSN